MMWTRELHAFTRRTLKGRYGRALAASLLYGGAALGFRLIPCLLAWGWIQRGHMTAGTLFLTGTPLWLAFTVLWAFLRFCILTPLRCGAYSWFSAVTGLETGGKRVFFPDTPAYLRGLGFFLCTAVCRFLVLLPCVAGAMGAAVCFHSSLTQADGSAMLFAAAQCLCLGAAGAVCYCRFCVGTAAVPFLYLAEPDISPLAAISRSCRMMEGQYLKLTGIVLAYLPTALPVVTIPFLLPYLMTNYVLFLQIRMREWAQIEEGRANAGAEIPYGAPRGVHAGDVSAA